MPEPDSLSDFDFNKIRKPGKFVKFEAGRPLTLRILTKDPVVQEREYTNKVTGEVNLSTKFCFLVWNFTDERAQILAATGKMAETFKRIGLDEDFGKNLQACDIKISPEGEMLERVYDINVLRHSGSEKSITEGMIAQAKDIDLDKEVEDNKGRLSEWEPKPKAIEPTEAPEPKQPDEVVDVDLDKPVNLDEIPF